MKKDLGQIAQVLDDGQSVGKQMTQLTYEDQQWFVRFSLKDSRRNYQNELNTISVK